MTQDAELQPIYCRWATTRYNMPVREVHFEIIEAREWSDVTFEEASVTVTMTLDNGTKVVRNEHFDADFMAGLLP